MSDLTVLRADRWVDIDAGQVRSPAVIVVEGERIAAVNPATVPERRDGDRPRRRHVAARPDGHGAQHAPRRAPRREQAQRRPGRPRVPHVARHRQLPHDAARRLHDRAQPRPVREDRRLPARRRARRARSTTAGSTARASCRPATRSRPRADTSTRRCSSGSAPTSCRSASRRASRTACPKCARPFATNSSTARGVIKISASGGVMSHSGARGRAAVLRRRARGDRRRGAPRRHQGRRARARRRRHPRVHPRRRRLHRARIARERRDHPDDGRATARSSSRRATCPRGSTSRAPRPSCRPRRPRCSRVRVRCRARRSRRA